MHSFLIQNHLPTNPAYNKASITFEGIKELISLCRFTEMALMNI